MRKPGRGEGRTNTNLARRLLTGISFWTGLTPELSRAALRPWASETQWYLHEAAKRARLERIVSATPFLKPSFELCCCLLPPRMIGQGLMELSPKPAVKRSESNSRGPTRTRTVTEVRGQALQELER